MRYRGSLNRVAVDTDMSMVRYGRFVIGMDTGEVYINEGSDYWRVTHREMLYSSGLLEGEKRDQVKFPKGPVNMGAWAYFPNTMVFEIVVYTRLYMDDGEIPLSGHLSESDIDRVMKVLGLGEMGLKVVYWGL